jgi:hypothetical protein
MFTSLSERLIYDIRKRYMRALLRQDVSWFDVNKAGEVTTRLAEYVPRRRNWRVSAAPGR